MALALSGIIYQQRNHGADELRGGGGHSRSVLQMDPVDIGKDHAMNMKIWRFLELRGNNPKNIEENFRIEVEPMSDEDFAVFAERFVSMALADMQRQTASIPNLQLLEHFVENDAIMNAVASAGEKLINYSTLMSKMVALLEARYPKARQVLDYLEHDLNNILAGFAAACSYLSLDKEVGMKCLRDMKMDAPKTMLYDIYTTNLHLMSGDLNLQNFNLREAMNSGAQMNAKRFGYKLISVDPADEEGLANLPEPRVVVNGVPANFVIPGDRSALMVALFNLEKNALKIADEKSPISVTISAERKNGAVYIYVTDTGKGLNYEDLFGKFQAKIQEKQDHSYVLQEWEFKILDGKANDPEVQELIREKLFERGVSFSESTGNGLAIVKDTVDAHQGKVSIDNFPGAGAIVTIVLPDTETSNRAERLRITQSALTADQLEK